MGVESVDWLANAINLIDSLWVTPQEKFDAANRQRALEAQLQAQQMQLQLAQLQAQQGVVRTGTNGASNMTPLLLLGGVTVAAVLAVALLK